MVGDKVSNLIIKIKNAGKARQDVISFPYSKFTEAILEVLSKEGYIKGFAKKGKKIIKSFDIEIAYEENGTPKVADVKRVSKLSKRFYKGADEMRSVRSGYGIQIISTSKGILSSIDAKKQKVGGEVLFEVW